MKLVQTNWCINSQLNPWSKQFLKVVWRHVLPMDKLDRAKHTLWVENSKVRKTKRILKCISQYFNHSFSFFGFIFVSPLYFFPSPTFLEYSATFIFCVSFSSKTVHKSLSLSEGQHPQTVTKNSELYSIYRMFIKALSLRNASIFLILHIFCIVCSIFGKAHTANRFNSLYDYKICILKFEILRRNW